MAKQRPFIAFMNIEKNLLNRERQEENATLAQALASPVRLEMIRQLSVEGNRTIAQVAQLCHITVSAATFHLKLLEKAQIIEIDFVPSKKGKVQLCMLKMSSLYFYMSNEQSEKADQEVTLSMPVGHYTDALLVFASGFCTNERQIMFDDGNFFRPERTNAQLIWGKSGYIEYTFINPIPTAKSLKISLEICSETLGWEADWKSEITFSINGQPIATYLSLSDYGDRRGILNPDWWPNENTTQYGKLVSLAFSASGVQLDGKRISSASKELLSVLQDERFVLRIENKDTATHVGGFNIFGRAFGDFPQDILLTVSR